MPNPSQDIQAKALRQIKDSFAEAERLSRPRRTDRVRIYKAYSTFWQPRENNWSSSFKINKAHEVIEKILPRIIAKNPKWIVSSRNENVPSEHAQGIQDYLTYIWDEYNQTEPARLWAKNMLIYGKGYAKVKYKYETAIVPTIDGRSEEQVVGEYPTIDVKSWTEMFYDPRYIMMRDRPYEIELIEGVRLADIMRRKDKYFNLDKLALIGNLKNEQLSLDEYKHKLQTIAGIQDINGEDTIDTNSLKLKVYYGYFNETEDAVKEKMYKICTVGDALVISYEEITQMPFEEIKCFEDPETSEARGFVEPIISLQDELNFAKNSASEYINKSLTRQMIWSEFSGIDPRDINNPVIATSKDGQTALANFVEMPHREINSSYFQKDNDIERQIQSMTFTVDTSNQKNQQALTNTATGIRVKFFESNSVIDEVRKHFEQGLERLAYKLLQSTFDNLQDNIVIKKQGTEGYWQMNKELLRDAITKYSIKVETNSSSFDDVESRREDAIAFFNIALQAASAGVPVDMAKVYKDVVGTFEKRDPGSYMQMPDIQQVVAGMPMGNARPIPNEAPAINPAAALTEQVAQGGITSAIK